MAEAGDIVWISIPFTAGVASAAAVPAGTALYAIAAGISLAVCTSLLMFCRKGKQRVWATILFYFLGALCMLSHELIFTAPRSMPRFLAISMESLCSLIDSIAFEGPQTGAIVKALLTGNKESLAPETIKLFRDSGGAHILALSGLHLGVLYAVMNRLLSILGNTRGASVARSIVIIAASAFYMVMTGASASIVRAFLFISINETVRQCPGRRKNQLNILCSALMIQLTFNPVVIRSVGFQLSYLAMLGIYTIYPVLDRCYPKSYRFDIPGKIWQSAAMSLSCQALTGPLVWMKFRTFPKFFLMTNVMALPLSELLIISSVICITGAAAGWCPDIMKSPVDLIARALLFCLETISTM